MNDVVTTAILFNRALDAALAAVCLVILFLLCRRWRWRSMPPPERFLIGGYGVLTLASGYAAVEGIVQELEPGLRSVFMLVAFVYIILGGLMILRRDDDGA